MSANSSRFSNDDKIILTELIKDVDDINIIEKKQVGMKLAERKNAAWETICQRFNAQSTQPRNEKQLKTLWHELKRKTKKAMSEQKRSTFATGGGPASAPLDPIYQAVVDVLPVGSLECIPGAFDSNNLGKP